MSHLRFTRGYGKHRWAGLCLSGLAILGSGCAPLLFATAGAVAGYAVSRDSVTLDLERSLEQVWATSLDVIGQQGRIKKQDRLQGRIDAQVRETDVVVTIDPLTPSTVRVVIRARKHLLPKVDVAQRLGVSIVRTLARESF